MVYEQNVYDITENTQINSNLLKPTHSDSKRFKENHKFSHITFVVKDFKRILNLVFFRETIYSAMREMQNSTNHNPHRNHQRSRNSTSSSSGFNNIRNRTHSWSNVDKRSTSAKPISAHSRQSSAIIPDSRYRTTSEGNAHFDIKPRSIGKSKRKNSSNQLLTFFYSLLPIS